MKKSLLLLLVAMMLPMLMGAMDLAENQRLLGHYTTDDLSTTGWGKTGAKGVLSVAIELNADELALYQGSKIVALRVGLAKTAPVTRVFIVPVDGNGNCGEFAEWSCDVSEVGWNLIELATPYDLNLPADYSLRIGFDYEQKTSVTKPLSVVNIGTIYPALFYRDGNWTTNNLNGNLSLQCIVEGDSFLDYAIRMRGLSCKNKLKTGDDLPFLFQTCRLGDVEVPSGACTYEIAIDGNVAATMTNPEALNSSYITVNGTVNTAGLSAGLHTLKISAVSVNGEPLEIPASVSCNFATFEFGFSRQMRLVEQFTSTECTWCPLGSQNLQLLCDMRGDIAWVGVHQILSSYDPFQFAQADTIAQWQGGTSFPTGSFDRTQGVDQDNANNVATVLSYNNPSYGANYFNSFLNGSHFDDPAWATVYINSTYDAATRKAVITVNGDLVPGFEGVMGTDSKLTVYITEDSLVARQIDQGVMVNDYVHNGVLRKALGSATGVNLKKTGDTYKNEFTVDIPEAWNADNLNIVAFISRPLRRNAYNDIFVTNTNMRKLGEFDEPTVVIGDLTGDGILNVADVTALISIVLNGDAVDLDVADLSGDGIVNVADVTALITLVLNGQ